MKEDNGGGRPTLLWVVVGLLLAAPFVGLLWVRSYDQLEPELFGFPFFYWYQMLWVPLSALCTAVAYALIRRHERNRDRRRRERGDQR